MSKHNVSVSNPSVGNTEFFKDLQGKPNLVAHLLEAFRIQDRQAGLGTTILEIAKQFKDVKSFLAAMEQAERTIRTESGIKALKAKGITNLTYNAKGILNIPAAWKQAKSNVKTAWEKFELDIHSFAHEGDLRKALNEARLAAKPKAQVKIEDVAGDAATDQVENVIDNEAAQALVMVGKVLSDLDDEHTRKCMIEDLLELAKAYKDGSVLVASTEGTTSDTQAQAS